MLYHRKDVASLHKIVNTIVFLLASSSLHAQNSRFMLLSGASVDVNNLKWSIAGNIEGQNPNILSELKFSDINHVGFYVNGIYQPAKVVTLCATYQRSSATGGTGTDIDYEEDNRGSPIYRLNFISNKGLLEYFNGRLWAYISRNRNFNLKIGGGYFQSVQRFKIFSDEIENLQSIYQARWAGAEALVGIEYKLNSDITLTTHVIYSLLRYKAKADWNLIDIFEHPESFVQESKGNGRSLELNLIYQINKRLALQVEGRGGNRSVLEGIDTSRLKNGTKLITQFNGSKYDWFGLKLGMGISF